MFARDEITWNRRLACPARTNSIPLERNPDLYVVRVRNTPRQQGCNYFIIATKWNWSRQVQATRAQPRFQPARPCRALIYSTGNEAEWICKYQPQRGGIR